MTRRLFSDSRKLPLLCGLLIFATPVRFIGQPAPVAVAAFDSYIDALESRLSEQHRSPTGFLAPTASTRLRGGELIVERLTPSTGAVLPGALLHHWRGTAFTAGAKTADFERLLKDFNAYPQDFSPEVLQARVLSQDGDRLQAWMRVR
ncbi:MAG: hypothetical protein WBP63_10145, partial [Silvibacterium sp.]